jgi:hypothetical protein
VLIWVPEWWVMDQSIRADRTKVSVTNIGSINILILRPRKQADATILQATRIQQCQKITIVLWLYSSNKVPPKRIDDMTARYEWPKGLKAKQMKMKFWHNSLFYYYGSIFWSGDQYLRERRRYGHPVCLGEMKVAAH